MEMNGFLITYLILSIFSIIGSHIFWLIRLPRRRYVFCMGMCFAGCVPIINWIASLAVVVALIDVIIKEYE